MGSFGRSTLSFANIFYSLGIEKARALVCMLAYYLFQCWFIPCDTQRQLYYVVPCCVCLSVLHSKILFQLVVKVQLRNCQRS